MFSIDVESLHTNEPLREKADYLCDFITWSNISLPIYVVYLRKCIIWDTTNIQFEFEGTHTDRLTI